MITVVGESLVDVVARQGHDEVTVHPGGSPANVAVALSRLGQRYGASDADRSRRATAPSSAPTWRATAST